jgi:hypothetical protein
VLSKLIDVQAAADWRAEGSFTALDAGRPPAVWDTVLAGPDVCGTAAVGAARPRGGQGLLMPGLRQTSAQMSVSSKQNTSNKYQHAPRAAATGGGATGSHPASWDPV